MNPRDLFLIVLKLFAAIFILFLTLETCARLDDAIKYGAPLVGEYSYDRLQSYDREGLRYNVPNARFEKWENNGLGFRGPEVMQNRSSGSVRVVCMGSSESYGLFESPGREWPAQLQEQLSTQKYEIVNASLVGFNLTSYDAYLKKHVFDLKPDIIVLVISPMMYVSMLENAAAEKNSQSEAEGKSQYKKVSLTGKLLANIRILPKIKQVIKQSAMNNFPGMLKRYQIWNLQKQIEEIEHLRLKGRNPMDSVPDIYLYSFRDDLNRLVDSIRSQGIEVMLTNYPTLISHDNITEYPEIFLDGRRFNIYLSLTGIVDSVIKFNNVIEHVAVEKKIMFFDASSFLPKSTDYFGDLFHYTDKGAQRFAEGVAAQLRSKQFAMSASVH